MTSSPPLGSDEQALLAWLKHYPGRAVLAGGNNVYRYALTRGLLDGKVGCFCMLNPSTADGEANDPTIIRCCGFAAREGWRGFVVVNLYAYRATYQSLLWGNHCEFDVVGPENDMWIEQAFRQADDVVFAWGAVQKKAATRVQRVWEIAQAAGKQPLCLGTAQSGQPRHPLMLAKKTPLEPWTPERLNL